MKQPSAYPDVIVNAFKSVQAWKSLSLVLIGVLIFETISLGWLASQRTVLLVPQHLPSNKGAITLNLGEPFSPDYLTGVAKGDLFALLNWTPENIDQQYGLFIARLTPALHDAQQAQLMTEVKNHQAEGLTQSFYVIRSYVKGPEVTLHGIMVRSQGGREVYRGPAVYVLTYTNAGNGMLMVSSVTQPAEHAEESKN